MPSVEGTRYTVVAWPMFGSDRWRWTLTAPGAEGPVVITGSVASYESEAKAIENGVNYARALAKSKRAAAR
jgi:hypothetical protein